MRHSAIFLFLILIVSACGVREEGDSREHRQEARRLYSETLRMARTYTDSLKAAPDSATATAAFGRFNTNLDSLSMTVEPNTDLLLTEGENDTIIIMLTAVRRAYEERLEELVATPAADTTGISQPEEG